MKTIKLVLPCIIALLLLSCKKSKTDPPVPVLPKVKTVVFSGETFSYEYDPQGRISRLLDAVAGQRTEFEYTPSSKVIQRTFNAAGTLTSQVVYELNSQGLAESYVFVLPVSGSSTAFEYNSNKQVTRRVQSYSGSAVKTDERYYYAADHRLDSVVTEHTNAAGTIDNRYRRSYTYAGQKTLSIGNDNTGYYFLGKQIPYACDKEVYKELLSASPEITVNYVYEYDAQNRITKKTRIYPPPDAPQIEYFTYY